MDKVISVFKSITQKIEESSAFEKVMAEYESLEPRQQKWVQGFLVLASTGLVLLVLAWPLWDVVQTRSNLAETRSLLGDMKRFQEEQSIVRRPAPKPAGYQPLAVSNPEETEESVRNFLTMIGFRPDDYEITSGEAGTTLKIPELTIRQAVYLSFQMEAWFPQVRMPKLKLSTHKTKKDRLIWESVFENVATVDTTTTAGDSLDDEDGMPMSPATGGRSRSVGLPGAGGMAPGMPGGRPTFNESAPPLPGAEDFEGDMPPPQNFEEDM
jgi:hypothetical protein